MNEREYSDYLRRKRRTDSTRVWEERSGVRTLGRALSLLAIFDLSFGSLSGKIVPVGVWNN